jgi:magnesium transporter
MLKVFYPSNEKKLGVDFGKVGGKFFWCNCESPSILDFRKISKKTGISIDDLKKYKNKVKLVSRQNYDIMLLKFPIYKSQKILLRNIEIIFNKKFVVTLYDGKIDAIANFVKKIQIELVGVRRKDYFYFLHRILVALSKEFLNVLDKIEIGLEKVEDDILKPKANIKSLFFVKKNLLNIRKGIVLNRSIISDLQSGSSKYLVPNMVPDIYSDITQILDTEELFRDRLTSSLDLHLSSISNKMNDIMKSFTVIASLLLIPMLVSGIYGMNVALPMQNNPNAFYTIILIILLSIIATILFFKTKKWI